MDEFLHHVSQGWYKLYVGLMLAYSVVVAAAYWTVRSVPELHHFADSFGLNFAGFVLAAIYIVYVCSAYLVIAKRNMPLATLGGSMLFALVLLNGMTHTDPQAGALAYIGAWLATIVLDGMFGLPFLLGWVMLTTVYVLLQCHFNPHELSVMSMVLVGWTYALAALAYPFWRPRFTNAQAEELDQLSSVLSSKQQQSIILIQSIADGVIVTNTEGKVSLMNPAAAAMTQWPVAEAVGIDAQSIVKLSAENGAELPKDKQPFAEVLSSKQRISQTLQLLGRDGKKQTISLVIAPILLPKTDKLAGAVAVMRDISQERTIEKQRGDFISTAAHEMRTPVAAIEGYLALALNDKVATIDTRARDYLEKAHASTQHLGKLFQDLLTSSKAEDGRLTSHPTVIEMGAYLQQLSDDLKFAAEKKGLFSEFILGSSNVIDASESVEQKVVKPLYYVYADADRMREVITNLFDNACKYTEQGKITIGLTGNNEVVQFYVKDTGPGIPKDDLPHLFQKFYRVDNSATRTIGGTGLGLFICRKIVELYNGRVWADSEEGKGSTFFINLPRLTTQRAEQLKAAETSQAQNTLPTLTPLSTS